uniref:CDC42 effector protein 4 n=1 Tax=Chelonoidis abingdonii TaxID=106734 RepID=A0A8C0GZ21_CHEAB
MPILKQLVSNSAHSKRRSRADLTAEMISAPLGDFRHTMHVGRAGDAFGDTSFLNSKAGEPDPGLDEHDFGDLTDLPVVVPKSSYGMKHAESIMSFHIDLGPSMLGDVLSIMDKDQWDQDEDFSAMVPEELRRDGGPTRVPAAHRRRPQAVLQGGNVLSLPLDFG